LFPRWGGGGGGGGCKFRAKHCVVFFTFATNLHTILWYDRNVNIFPGGVGASIVPTFLLQESCQHSQYKKRVWHGLCNVVV